MKPGSIGCSSILRNLDARLAVAAAALRPGAVLVCYVPTAVQLKDTVEAIQARSDFGEIESFRDAAAALAGKGDERAPAFSG